MPSDSEVQGILDDCTHPRNFFVKPPLSLNLKYLPIEETPWEIFRGRLLDASFTRQRRTFQSWNLGVHTPDRAEGAPFLSAKWERETQQIHIIRFIESYVHEPYDSGGNVIETREVRKWVRELVGSLDLNEADRTGWDAGLQSLLEKAVRGVSRLPLTSLEAPLPAFSLGQLGYFPRREGNEPVHSLHDLVVQAPESRILGRQSALIETVLRAADAAEIPALTRNLAQRWRTADFLPRGALQLFRGVFNDSSLSPYAALVRNALVLLETLEADRDLSTEEILDFLSHILRLICRHLTAFDLVLFHNRGANYPDALLIDELFPAFLKRLESAPQLFQGEPGRLRRRTLLQTWLLRARYQGHAVPDLPTSPGENARVLPTPRVPEEQLVRPDRRTRTLFTEPLPSGPVVQGVLSESVADLTQATELQELGTGLFLDRPLGVFKSPGEPDGTILLSYIAFSRALAIQRLRLLAQVGLLPTDQFEILLQRLSELRIVGLPIPMTARTRPGVASLADARAAADDWLLIATPRRAADEFRAMLATQGIDLDITGPFDGRVLIVGEVPQPGIPEVVLTVYDTAQCKRLELLADLSEGYHSRLGHEIPRRGFRLISSSQGADSNMGKS